PPLIYADPVDFGDVAVDGLRIVDLPVRSLTGDSAYLDASITSSGPFAIENQGPVLVPGDADVLVRISFRPTSAGAKSGVLKLSLQGFPNPTVAVPLRARGVTPSIEVAALHAANDPEQSPDHIAFGPTPLGAHTTERSIAITNVGTVTASLATPTF